MAAEPQDFDELVSPLIGKTISHAWKGYGSAIFLELGKLQHGKQNRHPSGESCIWIEWDWRVEDNLRVLGGSSESNPSIEKTLQGLAGRKISEISISAPPREICVILDDNTKLRTMSAATGDPQWTVRLPDNRYISTVAGVLRASDGSEAFEMTTHEEAACKHAEITAKRWGRTPKSRNPKHCRDCNLFVPIDGNFDLLDYGVCTCADGPNDGKAVHVWDYCEEFET